MIILQVLVADATGVCGGCSATFDSYNVFMVARYEDVRYQESPTLGRLQVQYNPLKNYNQDYSHELCVSRLKLVDVFRASKQVHDINLIERNNSVKPGVYF